MAIFQKKHHYLIIKQSRTAAIQPASMARRMILYLLHTAIGLTMAYPLLWMLGTSLKHNSGIFSVDGNIITSLFPSQPHWSNYSRVFEEIQFLRYYFNSILVVLAVMVGQVTTSSMAAFAFSRLTFPGRNGLFMCYLSTLMIPATVTLIPNFILIREIGIYDSYAALILPPLFSAYGTFMLRQFFLTVPIELEEAAVIDGCGPVRIFLHVVLPLSKSALITLAIFVFLGNWQSLLWPLISTNSDQLKTLPVGLLTFQTAYDHQWSLLMAASLMSIIPIVILFIFGQKFFISGIRLGAVKG